MSQALKLIAVLATSMLVGCASMCDSTYDCHYHAFGGMRERQDRVNGRVASLFDPAPALPSIASADTPLPFLDNLEDERNGEGEGSEETGDGSVEDSGLADDLIQGLDDSLEDLPQVPSLDSDSDSNGGGADEEGSSVSEI